MVLSKAAVNAIMKNNKLSLQLADILGVEQQSVKACARKNAKNNVLLSIHAFRVLQNVTKMDESELTVAQTETETVNA